ncbi:MAG: hypothetical protein OSJ64_05490, partial [Firmicutes bacterium]|nr:hypothetical protein [Bacillota bacterium]
ILNMEGSDITHMALQILAAAPQRILLLDKQSRVLAVTEDCLQQVLHRERAAVLMQFLPVALGFAEQGGCVEHLAEVLAVQQALEGFVPWSGQLHLPNNSLPGQRRQLAGGSFGVFGASARCGRFGGRFAPA